MTASQWWQAALAGIVLSAAATTSAQSPPPAAGAPAMNFPTLDMTYTPQPDPPGPGSARRAPTGSAAGTIGAGRERAETPERQGYRGVSSFFNVREANSNVARGEWEFEFAFMWATRSGESDEFELAQSLKYGVTDRFHVELEVEEPRLGEGGDSGAGDMRLTLFYQLLEETDAIPAIGALAQMRIPSGDGSSGVDGKLSAMLTKTFAERFRVHFQGFVLTANGASGRSDEERRPFQWGLGPGFDFQVDPDTLLALNYLHRVNEEEHARNQNILELGLVRRLGQIGKAEHGVKLALDVGLDGARTTPNLGGKLLWSIEW